VYFFLTFYFILIDLVGFSIDLIKISNDLFDIL